MYSKRKIGERNLNFALYSLISAVFLGPVVSHSEEGVMKYVGVRQIGQEWVTALSIPRFCLQDRMQARQNE